MSDTTGQKPMTAEERAKNARLRMLGHLTSEFMEQVLAEEITAAELRGQEAMRERCVEIISEQETAARDAYSNSYSDAEGGRYDGATALLVAIRALPTVPEGYANE